MAYSVYHIRHHRGSIANWNKVSWCQTTEKMHSAATVALPPTKTIAIRMKQMRSMTAAATIQSFIMRSFSSFSRRTRALLRAFVCIRSWILTSRRSVPLMTCPADSDSAAEVDEDAGAFGRWLSVSFIILYCGESSISTSSSSSVFLMWPTLDKHEHLTQNNVARYLHTTFLNCSNQSINQSIN